jgi:hypothetical protein
MQSAQTWREHTGQEEFLDKFQAAVNDNMQNNDDRAAAVETLILDQAVQAGVVK